MHLQIDLKIFHLLKLRNLKNYLVFFGFTKIDFIFKTIYFSKHTST